MVAMLAAGSSAIFTSVALLTKHDHWSLSSEEARALSVALNDAINTLPVKYYEQITSIIEKWIPWINLTFVLGAIIVTRVEESAERLKKPRDVTGEGGDRGDEGATNNSYNFPSSLGWDQR